MGFNIGNYELLKNALDAAALRQKTISSNISNVNTNEYKANKVIFEERLKQALNNEKVTMKNTNKGHLGGVSNSFDVKPEVIKDEKTEMKDNGNNVDIDIEMTNMAANQILYYTLIEQINTKISNMRYVVNDGRK